MLRHRMVDVDVIVTGKVPMPHAYVFRPGGWNPLLRAAQLFLPGGGETVRGVCLAYVVRHPTEGTILIDTGFHRDAGESLRKDFGTVMGIVARGVKPAGTPYEERLRELGVEPGEVERVIMTHLHFDHTSGMRLLPNAGFTCARREWKAATARDATTKGYVGHHLPPEERVELVDFEADGEQHGPFTSTIDLLGDGSIRLLSTPGHTPGHMSVLLNATGDRQVLVVGDAAYTLQSIEEERLSLLTANDDRYRASLKEIKAFTEQEPEAIVVPSHDPDAWRALEAVTAAAR
jgi:N-acyl homoserine lactone hydrolase